MNEAEEEDAMDVALREEKERQESSSNLEKASSSMSSSKGAVSSSSSASNDGEDELVNALRPFQNHAVSSRTGRRSASRRGHRQLEETFSFARNHLERWIRTRDVRGDGTVGGDCSWIRGTVQYGWTRAPNTRKEKEEKKDSVPE